MRWAAVIVLVLFISSANASPSCNPQAIGRISYLDGRAKMVEPMYYDHIYGKGALDQEKIVDAYLGDGDPSLSEADAQKDIMGSGIAYLGRLGLLDQGDIVLVRCHDYTVFSANGDPKYLTDGIVALGMPWRYGEFLPWLYLSGLLLLLLPGAKKIRRFGLHKLRDKVFDRGTVLRAIPFMGAQIFCMTMIIWLFGFSAFATHSQVMRLGEVAVTFLAPFHMLAFALLDQSRGETERFLGLVVFIAAYPLNLVYGYLLAASSRVGR